MSKDKKEVETPASPTAAEKPPLTLREPAGGYQPGELMVAERDDAADRLALLARVAAELMAGELQKYGPLGQLSPAEVGAVRRACVEQAHDLIFDCIATLEVEQDDDSEEG